MTVAQAFRLLRQALSSTYGEGEARSLARIVFEDAFGIRNTAREDRMASAQLHQLGSIQARLLAGEPVQYVLGVARFYGLDLQVDPSVLIPRPETEELVHWVIETAEGGNIAPRAVALDVGTGSGCIALALGARFPDWQLWGLDVSESALEVARSNAERLGTPIHLLRGDVLDPADLQGLPNLNLVVSNPPYITEAEAELVGASVRAHEPQAALFVTDGDPLQFYRAILRLAARRLLEGGWLFLELNEHHADRVRGLVEAHNYRRIDLRHDMQGKPRLLRARKPLPA